MTPPTHPSAERREQALVAFLKRTSHTLQELQGEPEGMWWNALLTGELAHGQGRRGFEEATQAMERLIVTAAEPSEREELLCAMHARGARLALGVVERHEHQAQEQARLMNVTSHDMRSSMVTVQGYMDMILQEVLGPLTTEQRTGLEVALRNARELTERLDVLLDYTRLEQGRLSFRRLATRPGAVLSEVEERFRRHAERRGLGFEVDWSRVSPSVEVRADPERLGRAIGLVVDNAIRYTRQGTVRVEAWSDHAAEAVFIVVRDTGRGLSPEALRRAREPFFRDEGSRTAGIGLTLSDALLKAHNASMSIASEEGHGCTVTIRLPLDGARPV